jgi:hypothetical protein
VGKWRVTRKMSGRDQTSRRGAGRPLSSQGPLWPENRPEMPQSGGEANLGIADALSAGTTVTY